MSEREELEAVSRAMHDAYEAAAKVEGWKTQESCQVEYDDLPEANKRTMLASAKAARSALLSSGYTKGNGELVEAVRALIDAADTFASMRVCWPAEIRAAGEPVSSMKEIAINYSSVFEIGAAIESARKALSYSEGVATSGRSGGDAPCQNEGIEVLEIGGKPRAVDASIAPLVKALNDAGFPTVASCSGHGERPGNIAFADGRELIIAQGYREARTIDRMFPGINGEQSLHDRAYQYADGLRAYLDAGGKLTGPPVEGLIGLIMNMTGHGADDTPPAQDTQRAERATNGDHHDEG